LQSKIDASILDNQLDLWTFTLDEIRPRATNPVYFTALIGDGLDPLLTREFAPVPVRAKSLTARLSGVAGVVDSAMRSLAHPPRIHTETA
ncbi:hypothetical protein ABTE42_20490, partial [Acinetobacter baumannii]